MATAGGKQVQVVDVHQLAAVVRNRIDIVLILDSRCFLEYNTCHVIGAVNVCCSKIVKRRLQHGKVTVKELLATSCQRIVDDHSDIVVYDQGSQNAKDCPADSFLSVLLQKLLSTFRSVNLVSGGFLDFQAAYPNLCEDKTAKCASLTSLSQPCLATTNQGPTRILPFLYLGSQHDALNKELLSDHNIVYELNVSTSCPKPDHIQDAHFLRIPVNDNYSEKLLPHFTKAFQFLDKVREASGGNVLVHCLAGISRSATIAIAYIMQHMRMTSDDAYRYVKSKRVTISPNFNFLGQLLEYEKQLRRDKVLDIAPEPKSAPILSNGQKRLCRTDMRSNHLTLNLPTPLLGQVGGVTQGVTVGAGDQSPTTALAKLSFGSEDPKPVRNRASGWTFPRSFSCGQDWLSCQEDSRVELSLRGGEQVVPFTGHRLSDSSKKSMHRLSSDGAVVPNPLDTLPQVEEIESEGSNDAKEQLAVGDVGWKGIPVSSLKELNFTPCQTSSSPSSASSNSSASTSHESTPDPFLSTVAGSKVFSVNAFSTQSVHCSTSFFSEQVTYSSTTEKSQEHMKWASELQSPVADTHIDFNKVPNYQRSDSVCTSGLGSEEGSDLQGTSSVEDNCDEDCDTGSTLRLKRGFNLGSEPFLFHLNLPGEKYTSSESSHSMCGMNMTETVRSPLSPSECHLLEDLVDEGSENSPENILECSQDSGILTSPNWCQSQVGSESSFLMPLPTQDELSHGTTKPGLPDNKSFPYIEIRRKRKSQQWEENPVSKVTEPAVSSSNFLLSTGSRDGLYRAQSCPGILSWFALSLEGPSAPHCGAGVPPSFMRHKGSKEERNTKCRNRNSCGSLDYVEYKPLHQYSSCESCPEVVGECAAGDSDAAGGTRERRGTLSPSHKVFQQSRDMIQVS